MNFPKINRSGSSHLFSQVPKAEIQRSSFDRSHGYKTTFDSGYLVPIFVDEALPGDTFNCDLSIFARLMTPIVPFMDNLHLDTFFFAVPMRLVWEHWQNFNGERKNPSDSTDYLIPTLNTSSVASDAHAFGVQSIYDYMGLPTASSGPVSGISALPFRAYNLIYNEWFRDQNLQNSVDVPLGDGPDDLSKYTLLRRGKRHDYFTSCLPWPQKGPGVELPLGLDAPVVGNGNALGFVVGAGSSSYRPVFQYGPSELELVIGKSRNDVLLAGSTVTTGTEAQVHRAIGLSPNSEFSGLKADLSQATAATINSLRQAFQLQRMYERDARGGTRYTEILRAHFGVISPDGRLQRPEYLGGSSGMINIHQVAQTSSTDTTSPQGNLAAYGVFGDSRHGFTKSFTEHCIIIGLACVRADLSYQQGLPRMFSRRTRFDFYWPALAHLGEQEVLEKEIYCQGDSVTVSGGTTAVDDEIFGYQERYAEYRYYPSMITGKLRSTDAQPLDMWHLAQKFESAPALNDTFITERPPLARVLAVTNEPQILFDAWFKMSCVRPMPVYSVPGLLDHF